MRADLCKIVSLVLLVGSPWLTGAARPRILEGPQKMPNVEARMETAGFWIERLLQPDRILLSAAQAQQQIRQWKAEGLLIDIFALPDTLARSSLRAWLTSDFSYLRRVARYAENGEQLQEADYRHLIKNVNLAGVQGSNPIKWGMTVRRTELRLFPADRIVTARPLDIEFNVLLNSGLRLAEPLAILHTSLDQQWVFVATIINRGWVKVQDIGVLPKRNELQQYVQKAKNVVVHKEMQFRTPDNKLLPDRARMGCELAFFKGTQHTFAYPQRDEKGALHFIKALPEDKQAMHAGPRACTPKVILEQAFVWLGVSYGRGGGSGYGDCSEFVRRIGLTCGLNLPRSTTGLRTGLAKQTLPGCFRDKQKSIAQLPGGKALLYLPGHIMLVLGTIEGRTFVVHNLYGIHGQNDQGDFIQRVARVVVSDLSLGRGSSKGSLLERAALVLFLAPTLDKQAGFE